MAPIEFNLLNAAPCRHGIMVWPKSDAVIGQSLALYGEFAEVEIQMMLRYLKPGDLAIDIGANLGTTVLPMAKAVGLSGQILAFEPQPLMAQCLYTTLSLNEIFNVRVFSNAVSEKNFWARMPATNIHQSGNFGELALSTEGIQIPSLALDEIESETCALVKIDVEGHEWNVIQGGQQFLLRHRPVLYLEAKQIAGTVSYLDWLMKNGWRCYWHFVLFFHPRNFRNNKTNIFADKGDMNILAVPKEQEQPTDVPEIQSADENWKETYLEFYGGDWRNMPFF